MRKKMNFKQIMGKLKGAVHEAGVEAANGQDPRDTLLAMLPLLVLAEVTVAAEARRVAKKRNILREIRAWKQGCEHERQTVRMVMEQERLAAEREQVEARDAGYFEGCAAGRDVGFRLGYEAAMNGDPNPNAVEVGPSVQKLFGRQPAKEASDVN